MTAEEPRLSRRDALVALAAGGITVGGGVAALEWDGSIPGVGDRSFGEAELAVLKSVAEVVYPTEVSGVPDFVEAYSVGRLRNRPAYADGVVDAARTLDGHARDWYDAPFSQLSTERREDVLREMVVDDVDPDPDGIDPERVRYYLVNELLYALYTSPTGGRLVGIENPQGHPGGLASYQRGPDS